MPNPLISKKTVVLAKEESSYGVDPTLAQADNAIEAYDFTAPVITADMKDRNPGNSDLSRFAQLRGKTSVDFALMTLLRGSGAAGTAPRRSPLYKACGFGEVVVSATSVTYAPVSDNFVSCAVEAYLDGIMHQILGCVGNYQLDLTAGEVGKETFNMKGKYAIPTDTAIVDPTFDTPAPEVIKNITMTVGGYSAIIEKLTLNMNNAVSERTDFNDAEGIHGFAITDRNPEGSMIVEMVLRATSNADFLAYFNDGTQKAISIVVGGTAGNICTISIPKARLKAPVIGDREGVRTFEIPFQLGRDSSGDDEIEIAFT